MKPNLIFLKQCWNFIKILCHQLRWRWRFFSFGWKSQLGKCDMLTNSRAISIGKNVLIFKGARLEAVDKIDSGRPKIIIGDGTIIHMYFHCGASVNVNIGRNVLIAGSVYITDHDHIFDDPELPAKNCGQLKSAPVIIEDGVWLGEGCVILKGVTVGKRAVVGSNAVVTKDVPPFTVVGGIPAKIIHKIELPSR